MWKRATLFVKELLVGVTVAHKTVLVILEKWLKGQLKKSHFGFFPWGNDSYNTDLACEEVNYFLD